MVPPADGDPFARKEIFEESPPGLEQICVA